MKTVHQYLLGTVLAGSLLLAGTLVRSAPNEKPPTPRGIAVVNLTRVFGNLNEKLAGDSEMESMSKSVTEEKRKREDDIENIANQLKNDTLFKKDSPEYKKMQDEVLEKSMSLQTFLSFSEQKLLMQQRLKTAQIYMNINNAIKSYAETNGIALIFMSNDIDFSQDRTIDAINNHIALRKVLYAHPDYDITQNVIEKMNTDYKLGSK